MGIYSSGLSCWQRRQAGLAQDNAGPETIDDGVTPKVVEEAEKEEKPKSTKKKPANSLKSSLEDK